MPDNFSGGASGSVTEVTSQNWFKRVGNALIGLLIGLLLVPGSIAIIAWNEGRAVSTAIALAEGASAVVDVASDRLDPANQGRLIHVAGPLRVPGTLGDPEYGVTAPGAAKLIRTAEMYQWQQQERSESRKTAGGGTESVTTYSYNRIWSSSLNDSSKFKNTAGHENPPFRIRSTEQVAPLATIGAYRLDRTLLTNLSGSEPLPVQAAPRTGRLANDGVYLGNDPADPALGDIRIGYSIVRPAAASVIARQAGDGFTDYVSRNGQTLSMIHPGEVSAAAMFKEANDSNVALTWALRVCGVVLMLFGFFLILNPAAVLADIIPFVGGLVGLGIFLTSVLLTLVVAPVTIAVAWLAVRPILGGGLLAVAAGGVALIVLALRRRRANQVAAPSFMPPRTT